MNLPNKALFDSKISKAQSGCWEWGGDKSLFGYGRCCATFGGKKRILAAHRVAWMFANGPIPSGMCVCHKCDNPSCVNPGHLFLGTIADNNRDRHAKGRDATGARAGSFVHAERMLRGERHPRAKVSDADVVEIRRAYFAGEATQKQLGERFGIRDTQVSNIVRGASRDGVLSMSKVEPKETPRMYAKGERHSMAKLSLADVKAIRELGSQGVPRREIAEKFGVSIASVGNILRFVSWKEAE